MGVYKARFYYDKGKSLFEQRQYANAAAFLQQAVAIQPDYPEALYTLASCCCMLGKHGQALSHLYGAIQLNPHCMNWALEDKEFQVLRDNELFQWLIEGGSVRQTEEGTLEKVGPVELEMEEEPWVECAPLPIYLPMGHEAVIPPEPSDAPPDLDDGKSRKGAVGSLLPPCVRCGGLVEMERRPRFYPAVMLLVSLLGLLCCTLLFVTWFGLFGLGLIAFGLYLFSLMEDVWVCQNCGAVGPVCGQIPSSIHIEKS